MLIDFDRSKISEEMMRRIEEEVMAHPDYTFENAYRASKSAPSFYDWVRAVREYYYVFKEIAPRRDAYMLAEIQYKKKKDMIDIMRAELKELEDHVVRLRDQQTALEKDVDILRLELKDCRERKRRAEILIKSLASER